MSELIGSGQVTVKGQRKLTNIADGRKVPQFLKSIEINQNKVPLLQLTKKFGYRKQVNQAKYFHLEEDMLPITVTTAATEVAADGTSIVLASGQGAYLNVYDELLCRRTNEVLRVTAISTDTLTVSRAVGTGGGAGAIIAVGSVAEQLQRIGNAQPEGGDALEGVSNEPSIVENYCQCQRDFIDASRRNQDSENYGADEWTRLRQKLADRMNLNIEQTFFFSPAYSASDPTMTAGLRYWISTNVIHQAGPLDETSLLNGMCQWKRHNQGEDDAMLSFCGDNVLKWIHTFGVDNIRYGPDDSMLGLEVATYQTVFGAFKFKQHGLFTPLGEGVAASDYGLIGQMYNVNVRMLGRAVFGNADLRYSDHIELPGRDGRKAGLLSDVGLIVMNEKAHMRFDGITFN